MGFVSLGGTISLGGQRRRRRLTFPFFFLALSSHWQVGSKRVLTKDDTLFSVRIETLTGTIKGHDGKDKVTFLPYNMTLSRYT